MSFGYFLCVLWRNSYLNTSQFFNCVIHSALFQWLSCKSFMHVWRFFPLSDIWFEMCSLILLLVFSLSWLFPLLYKSGLVFFFLAECNSTVYFYYLCFWYHIDEIIAKTNVLKTCPCVFLSFKSYFHFELIFEWGVW